MTYNNSKQPISVFSFFSGAGFLDLGFEREDFNVKFVNELHEPFMDAYKFSRHKMGHTKPELGYSCAPIQSLINDAEFDESVRRQQTSKGLFGFIGGPPCPDFSVGGKNRGREGDNGKLSKVYIDLVCKHKPDFFLFENVKGLWRTKKHREFYEEIKKQAVEAGYVISEKLINSLDYGAPQDRERIIMMGFHQRISSDILFEWPAARYGCGNALQFDWPQQDEFQEGGFLPIPNKIPVELTVEHWFRKNRVEAHPNGKHHFTPRAGLAKFLIIPEGDDSKKSYKRLHRWRYSPTAAYGNNEVHLHPYKARRISASEALAIQSLPSEFELPSDMTLSNMFKTIGNGVPFLAAKALAEAIKQHLEVSVASNSRKFGERDSAAAA
jgi:DNA (cytosine-5)-methyltransferase 1